MTEPKPRFQEFDALRALSILLLLLLHSDVLALKVFDVELGPSARFVGAFLLGSFFFLAGYFTEVSLKKSGNNAIAFFKSKLIRIYPPYWMGLALYVFVLGITLKRFAIYVYFLNLQAVFSPVYVKQVVTLWYISMLAIYYFVFVILLLRTKSSRMLLIWAVVVYAITYGAHLMYGLFDSRFFQYYFVFLTGIYFARFDELRMKLYDVNFLYKLVCSILGLWVYGVVHYAGYERSSGIYVLTVGIYILSWVWMWLAIFRTPLGGWRIWSLISTASFFAYLIHRPLWHILVSNIDVRPWGGVILFNFIPGSFIVLIVSYFLQRGYDSLLKLLHLNK